METVIYYLSATGNSLICPTEAIEYGEKTKGRKRYRHKEIAPKELLHHFQENGNGDERT